MNLVLNLPPETEARLKEQAAREGKDPETFALEALEQRLSPPVVGERMPLKEWLAKLHEAPNRLRAGNPSADVSRESAYEGCGE